MTYEEALQFISAVSWKGSVPGLSRITELMRRLGDPQNGMKFIHIVGTNGKGSTAAMLSSILTKAGYKTGLFISPYVIDFRERMQINNQMISRQALADMTEHVRPFAEAMADAPTEFELITAVALCWFAREDCDLVILEAGMGGEFDATNVIPAPEAAVFTNIGLDHTAVLGDTLEQIAAEKAGILKPGCEAVAYQQQESVLEVFRQKAREVGAGLHVADFSQLVPEFDSLEGQSFTYRGEPYALALLGDHQLRNAAVVLETVEVLRSRGWRISREAVEHGLYATAWPARFEPVSEEPPFIVDGGHNPQCAESVRRNLLHYFPESRRVLLVGVLRDKDYPALFDILNEAADAWVCVTPNSERALPAAELGKFLERYGKPVTVCESIPDGVETAREQAGEDGMACAVGSLYMAGAVRACFGLT